MPDAPDNPEPEAPEAPPPRITVTMNTFKVSVSFNVVKAEVNLDGGLPPAT